ncbi:MFS transporter [Dictyobacter sp. S3.2.2.5]|uniref:MFS transporter n=1 Tax=Dictyobacter halimunensis TaxID=3026934 RepID=A0ABQ6FNF0_9CHLR|nr:MFS transporter [Dictyobacter sp. S3.2.2.5]
MQMAVGHIRALTRDQRNALVASFLGWTLDAFDYFILVFSIPYIARDFHVPIPAVTVAVLLTLAMRPVGAFLFGIMADAYGRRSALMIDIILFSLLELLSGFAPSLTILLVLRALFGIAMGGEWGVGASLAMETIPDESRGFFSGVLQSGYVFGNLLASAVFAIFFPLVGWRGMFIIGALPAVLVIFIRLGVKESPTWEREREVRQHRERRAERSIWTAIWRNFPLFIYLVVLMTAFNFMSHGTQDLYPTFLSVQHKLSPQTVGTIGIIYNVGAIIGCIIFGTYSQRIGRKRAIIIAEVIALLLIPLWAFAPSLFLLGLSAFLMQFVIQGAFGVIPAHLNELSPGSVRGTFPGLTYQLGNLFASANTTIQAGIAVANGGNYSLALALVTAIALVVTIVVTALGREARDMNFAGEPIEAVQAKTLITAEGKD